MAPGVRLGLHRRSRRRAARWSGGRLVGGGGGSEMAPKWGARHAGPRPRPGRTAVDASTTQPAQSTGHWHGSACGPTEGPCPAGLAAARSQAGRSPPRWRPAHCTVSSSATRGGGPLVEENPRGHRRVHSVSAARRGGTGRSPGPESACELTDLRVGRSHQQPLSKAPPAGSPAECPPPNRPAPRPPHGRPTAHRTRAQAPRAASCCVLEGARAAATGAA